jgi:hypothetical protein
LAEHANVQRIRDALDATFMERSKGTLRPQAEDVLASDEHVVI